MAFAFGLLHGYGFAGALSEIGLLECAIPLALLFFNLGVEAGQLPFVAAVLLLWGLLRRAPLPVLGVAHPGLWHRHHGGILDDRAHQRLLRQARMLQRSGHRCRVPAR